jgi:hypothetical protein
MKTLVFFLADNDQGKAEELKWFSDRPHPGLLPQGEGETRATFLEKGAAGLAGRVSGPPKFCAGCPLLGERKQVREDVQLIGQVAARMDVLLTIAQPFMAGDCAVRKGKVPHGTAEKFFLPGRDSGVGLAADPRLKLWGAIFTG